MAHHLKLPDNPNRGIRRPPECCLDSLLRPQQCALGDGDGVGNSIENRVLGVAVHVEPGAAGDELHVLREVEEGGDEDERDEEEED